MEIGINPPVHPDKTDSHINHTIFQKAKKQKENPDVVKLSAYVRKIDLEKYIKEVANGRDINTDYDGEVYWTLFAGDKGGAETKFYFEVKMNLYLHKILNEERF